MKTAQTLVPKLAKDMIPTGHNDAPKAQQSWLDESPPEYNEFTRSFVSPRQLVFHLGDKPPKGSEQFGGHVAEKLVASPSKDGETPGEQV